MQLVSIVVPIYNGERYIRECADFIRKQTYQNIEVIFVNDGSTDHSRELCQQITKEDSRFRLINQKNGGTARARNAGLDAARGCYITFLDVDDEYHPEMIESLVSVIEKEQTNLAVCGYRFKVENSKDGKLYLEDKKWPTSAYHNMEELRNDYIDIWDADMLSNVWNKLYRMETIHQYGTRFRDGHVYTEDRVFNRLFLSKSQSIAFTDCCLYDYVRERTDSTTEKYREDYFDIRDKEYHEFRQHFQELEIWDEKSREYTSREFVERIAGCIENLFHVEKQLTVLQKYRKVREMIGHPDVREAIQYARCRSKKMRIFVLPIRWNWTPGAFVMGELIYKIRKYNPTLFHRLKGTR